MMTVRKYKKNRSKFNQIVYKAISASHKASELKTDIKKESDINPILRTKTNKVFRKKMEDMNECGGHVRSKNFVINNIEHFHPRTLKNIFKNESTLKDPNTDVLERPEPKLKRMNPYDEACIWKLLIRGCCIEKILECFPKYRMDQILKVKKKFRDGRVEPLAPDILSAIQHIRKSKSTHWF